MSKNIQERNDPSGQHVLSSFNLLLGHEEMSSLHGDFDTMCHGCHCPLLSPSQSCLTPPSCLISLLPLVFLPPVSLLVFLSLSIALLLTWSLIHLTRMHTHMHVNTCTYTYAHVTAYTCHTCTPESCHLLPFWVCVLLKVVTSGSIHFPVNEIIFT